MPALNVPITGSSDVTNVTVEILPPYLNAWTDYWSMEMGLNIPSKLTAQFVDTTDGFTEAAPPIYVPMRAYGRKQPILSWRGGSNRQIPIKFIFRANSQADIPKLQAQALFFDIIQQPYYSLGFKRPGANSPILYPPPQVWLTIGQFLRPLRCVTSSAIQWSDGFVPGTMHPHAATVSALFTSVGDRDYTFAFNGNSFPDGTIQSSGIPPVPGQA